MDLEEDSVAGLPQEVEHSSEIVAVGAPQLFVVFEDQRRPLSLEQSHPAGDDQGLEALDVDLDEFDSRQAVLLHKLVWHTITPSERQLADAAGIAAVQAGKLDLAYLREWSARQSTSALLEDVLQGKYLKQT